MFKKLHLRLTFFCSLAMGLILSTMTCFCLSLSENSVKTRGYEDFAKNASGLLNYLGSQSLLSHTWLSQMEHTYQFLIDIRDGDTPLLYRKLNTRENYDALFSEARKTAAEKYYLQPANGQHFLPLSRYETFTIRDTAHQEYYALAALVPKNNRELNVVILHSTSYLREQLLHQRLLFGGGALAAWVILSLLAHFFIGRMLRPLEENRRRQAQFIASASHELRAPLAVMLSSLSAAKIADAPQQMQFFHVIEAEGNRMSHLITDMLLLANSDSKSWSIHPAPTELDTLLLDVYEKYEQPAREKALHFQVQLPEDGGTVCCCDKERITQTLSILIDNAFSYTPAGGNVTLSLKIFEKQWEIAVADTGPGIPDEQKSKVFERFYRADASHHDREHFGLGLCIAKEIAALHKGKLLLTDTPGGGATFTLQIKI